MNAPPYQLPNPKIYSLQSPIFHTKQWNGVTETKNVNYFADRLGVLGFLQNRHAFANSELLYRADSGSLLVN